MIKSLHCCEEKTELCLGLSERFRDVKTVTNRLNDNDSRINLLANASLQSQKSMQQLSEKLEEQRLELQKHSEMLKKLDLLEQKLLSCEELKEKFENYVTKTELENNLNEISNCIEDYIVSATPRLAANNHNEKFEELENRLVKLESKSAFSEPEVRTAMDVDAKVPPLKFKRPQTGKK